MSPHHVPADIGRYLEFQPVLAGPRGATYRVWKYVRRYRLGVAAAGGVLLALMIGLIFAWDGYRDAKAAREREAMQRAIAEDRADQAGIEAARARAVRDLLAELLSGGRPYSRGRATTVATLLDDFDRKLGLGLQVEPEVEALLRLSIARAYLGLSELPQAQAQLDRARLLIEQLETDAPELRRALLISEGCVESGRLEVSTSHCLVPGGSCDRDPSAKPVGGEAPVRSRERARLSVAD